MQADLACEDRADDEFSPIVRIENPAGFGQVSVHCARCQRKSTSDLLVGKTAPSQGHAVTRTWMKPGRGAWSTGPHDKAPRRLECKDSNHLDRAYEAFRACRRFHSRKSARTHAVAQQSTRNGNPLVEASGTARIKRAPVISVELDDPTQIGPKKRALREGASANDRIATIKALIYDAGRNCGRVVPNIDAARWGAAQVGVMDERIMAEPEITGGSLHQQRKIGRRCARASCANKAVGQGYAGCKPRTPSLARHATYDLPPGRSGNSACLFATFPGYRGPVWRSTYRRGSNVSATKRCIQPPTLSTSAASAA